MQNRIKEFRNKFNLTQEELADKVGVRRETIVFLEKGKYNPSLELAHKVADILKTTVDVLFMYREEVETKWGKDVYKKSDKIVKSWSKEKFASIKEEGEEINRELAKNIDKKIDSDIVQALIKRHFQHITRFYDPSWPLIKIYRGLGKMYAEDYRFAEYYKQYHPDLPQFLSDAIGYFCDRQEE